MSLLDPKELKLVVTMLQRQRMAMAKSQAAIQDEKQRAEFASTLKLLDSALGKLTASVGKNTPAPMAAPALQPVPQKKVKRKEPIALSEARVLVADDSIDSMMMLRGILADVGIKKIDCAKDGREALNALHNNSPAYDLVLCDWDMPEMTGLEVRKQIKQLAKFQDTHFMMVTSVSEAAKIREAIGQGITDYIVKPIDTATLEKKIRVALGWDAPDDEKAAPAV
jgi:two-component system, chemotaxis family, chemotaxis protein CheY